MPFKIKRINEITWEKQVNLAKNLLLNLIMDDKISAELIRNREHEGSSGNGKREHWVQGLSQRTAGVTASK